MTRRFYADPLAAAWMAKHHGFTLYLGDLAADDFDAYSARNPHHVVEDWDFRNRPGGPFTPVDRVYLHPDCLPLLEPRLGDVLRGDEAAIPQIRYMDLPDHEQMGAGAALMRRGFKIIQRDGLAFFWPESEAA